MKKVKKIVTLLLCAALLVGASVAGTVAYLTADDEVVNTFTVGKVAITLDETDVDNSTEGEERDQANAYRLIPGSTYVKDPIVHVDAESESSWVFVKVVNQLAAYEADATTEGTPYTRVADQIIANGWQSLSGVDGVYYMEYTMGQPDKDLEVFEQFAVAGNLEQGDDWDSAENMTITVTAYAIQKAGFESDLAGAWTAVSTAGSN